MNSGKVAVSAAAKATTLSADLQQKVAEKAEERIRDNKHANIAAIIREISPKSSENDAEERFGKSKKNLAACLKLLDGIDAAHSRDILSEMQSMVEKLRARLNEIGGKIPDSSNQEIDPDSDDHQESHEASIDAISENAAIEEEDVEDKFGEDEPDFTEHDPSNCIDDSVDLPEGWSEYEAAMKIENAANW